MTKKHLRFFIFVLLITAGLLLKSPQAPVVSKPRPKPAAPRAQIYHPHVPEHEVEIVARPIPAVKRPVNQRSQHWQQNLEHTLTLLGGKELKTIQINRVESITWKQDNMLFNAESVMVRLTNQQGHETSFRAVVDAQTGKILQTWDQPVIDHVNPRENFGIRLDPRYENL